MIKTQKGFTLIELVMIVVILGILAAVAIPRYISLQADARAAAVNGLFGTVRSAAAMIKATALVRGVTNGNITTEDGTIVTVVNRYPATAAGGIDNAVEINVADFTFAAGVFSKVGATTPANCSVTYVQPAALGSPPTITVDVTGC
jgi:MSHA pilin protein MshA